MRAARRRPRAPARSSRARHSQQYLAATGPGPASVRRRACATGAAGRCSPTSRCAPSSRKRRSRSTDAEVDAEIERLAERLEREARKGAHATSNGGVSWRRYALISRGGRRSSSSSSTRPWSTRTGNRDRSLVPDETAEPRPRTDDDTPKTDTAEAAADTSSRGARSVSDPIRNYVRCPTVIQQTTPRRASVRHLLAARSTTASSSSARRSTTRSRNLIIAQLLHLESRGPRQGLLMYINSPGGEITGLFAIYDTMQYIKPDVQTICVGQAASAAAVLLASGAHGQALHPPARPGAHPPAARRRVRSGRRHRDPGQGDHAHARAPRRDPRVPHRARRSSGSSKDTDRDFIMSARRGEGVRPRRRSHHQP